MSNRNSNSNSNSNYRDSQNSTLHEQILIRSLDNVYEIFRDFGHIISDYSISSDISRSQSTFYSHFDRAVLLLREGLRHRIHIRTSVF